MDLSKVLGDVYDTEVAAASPVPQAPAAPAPVAPAPAHMGENAPEWADEARLDRAFASWTPGPPADAPAAEREYAVAGAVGGPARAMLDEMLAATEVLTPDTAASEVTAVVAPPPPPPAPAYEAAYAAAPASAMPAPVTTFASTRQWVRGDDDIVQFAGRSSGRRGLSLRRRP